MQGHLFRAAFLRHVPLFVRNLAENVVLCLAAASVESTAKTVMAHMELVWRRKLTSRMHLPYFENMVGIVTCMHLQIPSEAPKHVLSVRHDAQNVVQPVNLQQP